MLRLPAKLAPPQTRIASYLTQSIWSSGRQLLFLRLEAFRLSPKAVTVRSASSKAWTARQSRDQFAREARVQGLKSRAAFKLLQINEKYRLFKRGQTVVDLGYAPGSWSQVRYTLNCASYGMHGCLDSSLTRDFAAKGSYQSNSTRRQSTWYRLDSRTTTERRFNYTRRFLVSRCSSRCEEFPPRYPAWAAATAEDTGRISRRG